MHPAAAACGNSALHRVFDLSLGQLNIDIHTELSTLEVRTRLRRGPPCTPPVFHGSGTARQKRSAGGFPSRLQVEQDAPSGGPVR